MCFLFNFFFVTRWRPLSFRLIGAFEIAPYRENALGGGDRLVVPILLFFSLWLILFFFFSRDLLALRRFLFKRKTSSDTAECRPVLFQRFHHHDLPSFYNQIGIFIFLFIRVNEKSNNIIFLKKTSYLIEFGLFNVFLQYFPFLSLISIEQIKWMTLTAKQGGFRAVFNWNSIQSIFIEFN